MKTTEKTMKRVARRTSFEYRDDRSRNLLEVFNRLFSAIADARVEDVLRLAVAHPARRFWVSEERALRVVHEMERTGVTPSCNALKHEMYEEIYRRVCMVRDSHPHWTLARCVGYVVNQEAPSFYLSVSSAHAILVKEKRRCRMETLRRLSRHLAA